MKNKNNAAGWLKSLMLNRVAYSVFLVLTLLIPCLGIEAQDTANVDEKLIQEGTMRLSALHAKLRLVGGNFQKEYPEQLMSAMFLPKEAIVLELGGNIGRNSCVIGSILNDSSQLVVVESCAAYAKSLQQNRDLNGLKFHIEASAISKVPLIQRGWKTIPSEVVPPKWGRVKTITFAELKRKYRMEFDTLVVDCEGALYYILKDDPEMLKNIKLVIIENDFDELEQMQYVHELFSVNGLKCIYNQPLHSKRATAGFFYQVWKK